MDEADKVIEDIVRQKIRPFVERVLKKPDNAFSLKISARQGHITGYCTEENEKHKS